MAKLYGSKSKCYRNWEYLRPGIVEKGFMKEMEIEFMKEGGKKKKIQVEKKERQVVGT